MTLALISGSGALPAAVAAAMPVPPLICNLEGNVPADLAVDLTFRLEHLGTFIAALKERGITTICLCGSVKRPDVDIAQIDAATLPLVPVIQRALQPGDDGALRAIIDVFESQGFSVKGAHEIAPGLLPPEGVLSVASPDSAVEAELFRAAAVLAEMARIDEGQACVIRADAVLAQEDARGTDAMLADLTQPRAKPMPPADDPFNWIMDTVGDVLDDTADWLSGEQGEKSGRKGAGGLLVKAPKPGQDRRADLPTIGPDTVRGAARAGLRGIVIQTQGVIVLDRPQVIALCDKAGLFLAVRTVP